MTAPPLFTAGDPGAAAEVPAHPGLGPGQVLGLLGVLLLGILGVQACLWFATQILLGGSPAPSPTLILCLNQLVMLGTAGLGFRILGIPWRQTLAQPQGLWSRGALLVLAWLAFLVLEIAFMGWLSTPPSGVRTALADHDFPLALLPVLLLGPLAEEAFFRGVLCEGLARRYGSATGIAVSALLFALAHGHWLMMPGCLMFGLFTGLLQRRTGVLHLCVAVHMFNNGLATVCA